MRHLFCLAISASVISCSAATVAPSGDAAVLRSVLADEHFVAWVACDSATYALDPVSAPPAFQHQKPFFYSALEGYAPAPDSLTAELLASLQQRNAVGTPLPEMVQRDAGLLLRTTGARVWLSLPGYDAAGNAAVSVTRNTAGECFGAGYVVLLRRLGDRWVPAERPVEWVD